MLTSTSYLSLIKLENNILKISQVMKWNVSTKTSTSNEIKLRFCNQSGTQISIHVIHDKIKNYFYKTFVVKYSLIVKISNVICDLKKNKNSKNFFYLLNYCQTSRKIDSLKLSISYITEV